jgi:ubiquitin carboxyl-terminal hydrolase L5
MNIINNHMSLDLGQQLNKFRFDTLSLTPKERGTALDQFDPVRNVHNSFAT